MTEILYTSTAPLRVVPLNKTRLLHGNLMWTLIPPITRQVQRRVRGDGRKSIPCHYYWLKQTKAISATALITDSFLHIHPRIDRWINGRRVGGGFRIASRPLPYFLLKSSRTTSTSLFLFLIACDLGFRTSPFSIPCCRWSLIRPDVSFANPSSAPTAVVISVLWYSTWRFLIRRVSFRRRAACLALPRKRKIS